MEYLFLVCELAAVFAGFTAIVSVMQPETEQRAGEHDLNKLRLRQMLEVSLFTIAIGLIPALFLSLGLAEPVAMRYAGALAAAGGILLTAIQVVRGFRRQLRDLPGYSIVFARFMALLGLLAVSAFTVAAAGAARATGAYMLGATLVLAVAALQFLRTSTSVLRFRPARAARPPAASAPWATDKDTPASGGT